MQVAENLSMKEMKYSWISNIKSVFFVSLNSVFHVWLNHSTPVPNQALAESTCLPLGTARHLWLVFSGPFIHSNSVSSMCLSPMDYRATARAEVFPFLFCVGQANFETTCDDTGGATIENTLQDVTSVARKGPKPAAAGLPLLHHAEAPGILEKIGFRKVLKAKTTLWEYFGIQNIPIWSKHLQSIKIILIILNLLPPSRDSRVGIASALVVVAS